MIVTDEIRAAVEECIRRACVKVRSGEWFCVDQWLDGSLNQRHGFGPFARNADEDEKTIFVQEAIIDLDPCGDYDADTPQEDLIAETVRDVLEDWEREI